MEFLSILKDILITRVMNAVAAGVSVQDSAIVDNQDYDGVCFIALFNTVVDASILALAIQGNTANAGGGMVQLVGGITPALTALGNSNCQLIADVYRPVKRFLRAEITRTAQNATIDGIIALQYRGRVRPVTQPAGVAGVQGSVLVTGV